MYKYYILCVSFFITTLFATSFAHSQSSPDIVYSVVLYPPTGGSAGYVNTGWNVPFSSVDTNNNINALASGSQNQTNLTLSSTITHTRTDPGVCAGVKEIRERYEVLIYSKVAKSQNLSVSGAGQGIINTNNGNDSSYSSLFDNYSTEQIGQGSSTVSVGESLVIGSTTGCSGSTTTKTFNEYPGIPYYLVGSYNSLGGTKTRMEGCSWGNISANSTTTLSVSPPMYQPPESSFDTSSSNPDVGETVELSTEASDPDDGSIAGRGICNFHWEVTKPNGSKFSSSGVSRNYSFTPQYGGLYQIKLTTTDNEGEVSSTISSIYVKSKRLGFTGRGEDDLTVDCVGSGGGGGYGNSSPSSEGSISRVSVSNSTGNTTVQFDDPVTTRGYPLKNNVTINSVTRYLPIKQTALGNADFSYGLSVRFATRPDGQGIMLMVLDGDGTELEYGTYLFGASTINPESGIYSELEDLGVGGFRLKYAGEPGRVEERGGYEYQFNQTGVLKKLIDPEGNEQELYYGSDGVLTEVRDLSSGRSIYFDHDLGSDLIKSVREGLVSGAPIGSEAVRTEFLYNQSGCLSRIVSKSGAGVEVQSLDMDYAAGCRVSSVKTDNDPNRVITFSYEDSYAGYYLGNMTWTNGNGVAGGTDFSYFDEPISGAVARTVRTSSSGAKTYYDYDGGGNLIRVNYPKASGESIRRTISMSHDSDGNLLTWADGMRSFTYTYNQFGLPLTVVGNNGESLSYEYQSTGVGAGYNITKIEDSLGELFNAEYADLGLPYKVTAIEEADGDRWEYEYNGFGQLVRVVPPTGSAIGEVLYEYDEVVGSPNFGWLKEVTDGAGRSVNIESYTPLGDVASLVTSPSSGVSNGISFEYDPTRRLRRIEYDDGKRINYNYTGRDLTSVEDESGIITNYDYCESCGKMTSVTEPMGRVISWLLDGDFGITEFTDSRGGKTQYQNGDLGELKFMEYPDGLDFMYSYADGGGVKRINMNTSAGCVRYGYDARKRLSGVNIQCSGGSDVMSFGYRADDTLSSVVDQVGTRTIGYNVDRNVSYVEGDYNISGVVPLQRVEYGYNPDGSIDFILWKSGGVQVARWDYGYDLSGNVISVNNSFGESVSYEYDGENKVVKETRSNGTEVRTSYNETRDWTTSYRHLSGGTEFSRYDLTYDGGLNTTGNLTGVVESGSVQGSSTVAYQYDQLSRLISEVRTGVGSYTRTYEYDLSGNVTKVGTGFGGAGGANQNFATYDLSNKISSISGGSRSHNFLGGITAATVPATYSGGVPSGGALTFSGYSYNVLGKLTSGGGETVRYTAEGLRGAVKPNSTSPFTVLIYAGERVIGEISSSGAAVAYTWGPTGIVSKRDLQGTPKSAWYHFGPQGETRYLTDSVGVVTDSYRYTAYGRQLNITGSSINPYRYGGRYGYYTDLNLKVIAAGQRYYAPELYRWLTRDPIKYDGGDNVYAYVKGNPVKFVDPDGLEIYFIDKLSNEEQKIFKAAISKIESVESGKNFMKKFQGKGSTNVYLYAGEWGASNLQDGTNNFYIDFCVKPKLLFEDGVVRKATLPRIIVHELSHALGYNDDGIDKLNNVNAYENPIMKDLGEKNRIKYESVP